MMKTYARIDCGVVVEFFSTDGDIAEMFHPSMVWIDVTSLKPEPEVGHAAVKTGNTWAFSAPVVAPVTADEVRAQRDSLIAECDWLVQRHRDEVEANKSTTLTTAQYQAWLTYRQALRDVPTQAGFPTSVQWPATPA